MNTDEKQFEVEHETSSNMLEVIIKLASNNKNKLETVCKNFYNYAASKVNNINDYEKMNKKTASITTRKSPCGEGTNTYARYKLHVYSRNFNFEVSQDILAKIADFLTGTDVEIILTIKK
ncbi:hypothetical protein COBT_000411 [Conglomerata obtusa]